MRGFWLNLLQTSEPDRQPFSQQSSNPDLASHSIKEIWLERSFRNSFISCELVEGYVLPLSL